MLTAESLYILSFCRICKDHLENMGGRLEATVSPEGEFICYSASCSSWFSLLSWFGGVCLLVVRGSRDGVGTLGHCRASVEPEDGHCNGLPSADAGEVDRPAADRRRACPVVTGIHPRNSAVLAMQWEIH